MRTTRIIAIVAPVAMLASVGLPAAGDEGCTTVGTPGDDFHYFIDPSEVFCGLSGDDRVYWNFGTFRGGEGADRVWVNWGRFEGGQGGDSVDQNMNTGVFVGGNGEDAVRLNWFGTFEGGPGDDAIEANNGAFEGGPGLDTVGGSGPDATFIPGPR